MTDEDVNPDGDANRETETGTEASGDPHAHTLLVAGTASHVGKSTVAAGLCRALADAGVAVAPFKAQNMSNNARAVPTSTGEGFGEIGVSQYVQARAARVPPETDHNPVLLKPRGEGESQLVIDGEAVGHYAAGSYYEDHWERARGAAVAAHARLAAAADVVVAEGAGSVAEINLHDRDLANVETARFAAERGGCSVVLVADIERGGVFASLVGTLELLPGDIRERVVGAVITKFRGDRALLDPGLEQFRERTGVPVLGVLPYEDPGLPEEDSVALPGPGERATRGDDDGVPADRAVTVAVPRLPRASNVTDLGPLARESGVRVLYVPVEGAGESDAAALAGADALVLTGTKNTVDDLLALRASALWDPIRSFEGPVVGLCGGYQLLGDRLVGAAVEGTGDRDTLAGLGLLPVETRFSADKRVAPVRLRVDGVGPLAGAEGVLEGYEIHMGETTAASGADLAFPFALVDDADDSRPPASLGSARGAVLGTYLHDLFANRSAREAFLAATAAAAGRDQPVGTAVGSDEPVASPSDRAAALVREHVDLEALLPVDLQRD